MFPCRWTSCDLHFDELDALYDHLSESHVGRKISNTLTLTCGWGECRASYNKRDHLTSHLRSHVPLKPHLCPVCSRGFKRPQDLKKHEKLHEPGHVGRGGSITDMAERDCQAGRIGISASEDNPSWQTATQPQSYAQPARKMSRESLAKPYATIKSHPPRKWTSQTSSKFLSHQILIT
ncbi:hypothetical protein BCR33DRAFT_680951 [Rhizoclosmatium globosum]|uniref:C2H2-type domain-containing protein n=1 Tax=Rhizoclosmatium globosum TaxID=329046 RepID=A0A1Y2C4R5_9FUNG|nr:hypothetical protein BCR33DRAFT_680951 [Rhizoclosmatium globosum]|eukprot:ORY41315.1 hypothetical protein BCR33DRAFT_680951 [Rhizoclosmatium globosum]